MHRRRFRFRKILIGQMALGFTAALSVGCTDGANTPTALAPSPIVASRAGGGGTADPTTRWEVPASGSLKIQGSSNAFNATTQTYVFDNGACGVKAVLFEGNGGGDATMQANANWNPLSKAQKAACGGATGALRFDFPSGSVMSSDIHNVWGVGIHTNPARPGIAVFAAGASCGQLRYGSTDLASRNLPQVQVTLISGIAVKRQWRVESTPSTDAATLGQHLAYCYLSGQTYDMPFVIYVNEK